MKKVAEVFALFLLTIFLLGLVFLFQGDPDLWDRLHDRAMSQVSW